MNLNQSNNQFNNYLMATYTEPNLTTALYGCLKHANILPGHPHRDDLIQECHLALAQALQEYDQISPTPKINRNTYAYQRMRWCLGKYFERNSRDRNHSALQLDAPLSREQAEGPAFSYEFNLDEREHAKLIVRQLLQHATDKQCQLIKLLLADPGLTNQELATQLQISPQALSYHRKQLRLLALRLGK